MTSGSRHRLWLGAILLLTFLVYSPGLGNDYTYDGRHYARGVTDDGQPNYMVQEWRGLAEYFRRPMHYRVNPGRGYRPVTVISYAALHNLFKDSRGEAPAWPSHLLDTLLHVLATWLCYLLLVQLLGTGPPALLATLVFGLHALRSDVVLSIVGRADILAFVFGAAGLRAFVASTNRQGGGRLLLAASSAVCLFLAYCSKESAVAWAVFLPLFSAAIAWQRGESVGWRSVLGLGLSVALVPLVIYLGMRAWMLSAHADIIPDPFLVSYRQNPLMTQPFLVRAGTGMVMLSYGLYLVLAPFDLCCDYGAHVFRLVESVADWRLWGAAALLLGLLGVGMVFVKRQPPLFLAVATFLGFSFLTSNLIIEIEANFAERFYYTPAWALSFLVAWLAMRCWDRPRARRVLLAVVCTWCVVSSIVAVGRCLAWRNNEQLFATDLVSQPRSISLRMYRSGIARKNYFRARDAAAQARTAVERERLRQEAEAARQRWRHEVKAALEIDDESPDPLNSMAIWCLDAAEQTRDQRLRNAELKKAEAYLERVLASRYCRPAVNGPLYHGNLAMAYRRQGRLEDARDELLRGLHVRPTIDNLLDILDIDLETGSSTGLAQVLQLCKGLFPTGPNAGRDLGDGVLAYLVGDHPRAAALLPRAMPVLEPNLLANGRQSLWGRAWLAAAVSLAKTGQVPAAAEIAQRMLSTPGLPPQIRQLFIRLVQELRRR